MTALPAEIGKEAGGQFMGDLDKRLYDLSMVVNRLNTTVLLNAKEQEHLATTIKGLGEAVERLNLKIDGKFTDLEKRIGVLENVKLAGRWFLIGIGFFLFAVVSSVKDAASFITKIFAGG